MRTITDAPGTLRTGSKAIIDADDAETESEKVLTNVVEQFMRATNRVKGKFDAVHPDLVKVVADVKSRYGLMDAALTDTALTSDVTLIEQIKDMMRALDWFSVFLADMIAVKATKL